jgi:hypothetical protein
MRDQWRVRAHSAARTRLTHEYWDRYRQLFDEIKAEITAALANGETTSIKAQSRAKTRLVREYPLRFQQLYAEELDKLAQLHGPRPAQSLRTRPVGVHWRPGR